MSKYIDLTKQLPIQNIERILACQKIREIGPEKIKQLDRKHEPFLIECIGDNNLVYDIIDWEFAIFQATNHQLAELLTQFVRVPKSN